VCGCGPTGAVPDAGRRLRVARSLTRFARSAPVSTSPLAWVGSRPREGAHGPEQHGLAADVEALDVRTPEESWLVLARYCRIGIVHEEGTYANGNASSVPHRGPALDRETLSTVLLALRIRL